MQLPRARAVMLSGFVTMIFVAALLLQPEASRAPEPAADLTPGAAAMTATLTPEGLIEVSTRGGSLVLDAELQRFFLLLNRRTRSTGTARVWWRPSIRTDRFP